VGAAALVLVVAAPASAATPADKKIAKLELQMKSMTSKVVVLQKQVVLLQKQLKQWTNITVANFAADACAAAGTADAFTATWSAIDRIGATQAAPTTYFGPQALVDDKKACADIKLARPAATTPPTLSSFVTMINFLYG
jgi:hypothetical protein